MKKYFSIFTFLFLAVSSLCAAHLGGRAIDYTEYTDDGYYAILTGIDTGGDAVGRLQSLFAFKDFNPSKDTNIVRASFAGFLTRKAFIKLSDEQFTNVVSNCFPFFSTPYGFSLIHGWMLNKFRESTTPYYIGTYFSFDKFFWGMVNAMPATIPGNAKSIIKRAWWSARADIEANRWGYYDNMLYLPYAIEQAGVAKAVGAPTIDMVIADSRTTPDAFFKKSTAEFRAAMRAKVNAFLTSGALEPTDNPQQLFSDIMAWVLAHHINLSASILLADASAANFNIKKFVNYITDRAFTLYEDMGANPDENTTLAQVKSVDINVSGLQFGQALQMYLDALVESIKATINDRDQFKDLIFATVKEAIGKAKRAQVVSASLITLAPPVITVFSAPEAHLTLPGLPLSPQRGGVAQAGLEADDTYLGQLGVYFTPVHWADGQLARYGRYDLADILKTFESYLIKQKDEVDHETDLQKGSYCGRKIVRETSRTCLAEVRGWRYKLLSQTGATAEAAAKGFILSERGRDRFKESMRKKK